MSSRSPLDAAASIVEKLTGAPVDRAHARRANSRLDELRRAQSMHFDAEFYVAVGFTIFVLVLLWVGAHSKFTAMIDARINRIKSELAEAERLRAEAEIAPRFLREEA